MNVNNLTGKLTKNADKIGILFGVLDDGLDTLMSNVMTLISGQGHMPDLQRTIETFFMQPELQPAIMMWILGYGLKEFGFAKYGNPISKFSEGYLKGITIGHVLHWSTHADEGSRPGGEGLAGMFDRVVRQPNRRQELVIAY